MSTCDEVRSRSIEEGGRICEDLGLGRVPGQVLVYLYLTDGDGSLDKIGEELGFSKAAVSIAVRRLEGLGLLKKGWKAGDRKNYYRTADNLETALQKGVMNFLAQRMQSLEGELLEMDEILDKETKKGGRNDEAAFLRGRIRRIRQLQGRLGKVLRSPFIKILTRA